MVLVYIYNKANFKGNTVVVFLIRHAFLIGQELIIGTFVSRE